MARRAKTRPALEDILDQALLKVLSDTLGGTTHHIPKKGPAKGALARLPPDILNPMIQHMGGRRVYIPLLHRPNINTRDRLVVMLLEADVSMEDIIAITQLTERKIYAIKAKMKAEALHGCDEVGQGEEK